MPASHEETRFSARRKFHDPVTGDELTIGEEASWVLQGVIRRWVFIIIVTICTLVCWFLGPTIQFDWNLGASYLAILIESIVGIAMFSATRRDAVILRKIDKAITHLETLMEQINVKDH